MAWEFDNEKPIHNQLVDRLILLIISETYKAGDRIPSVRELALEAKVNPNTMQKALTELENRELIYTKRTSGKYVTEDKKIVESLKNEIADKATEAFLDNMKKIGFNNKEIINYLKEKVGI